MLVFAFFSDKASELAFLEFKGNNRTRYSMFKNHALNYAHRICYVAVCTHCQEITYTVLGNSDACGWRLSAHWTKCSIMNAFCHAQAHNMLLDKIMQ